MINQEKLKELLKQKKVKIQCDYTFTNNTKDEYGSKDLLMTEELTEKLSKTITSVEDFQIYENIEDFQVSIQVYPEDGGFAILAINPKDFKSYKILFAEDADVRDAFEVLGWELEFEEDYNCFVEKMSNIADTMVKDEETGEYYVGPVSIWDSKRNTPQGSFVICGAEEDINNSFVPSPQCAFDLVLAHVENKTENC